MTLALLVAALWGVNFVAIDYGLESFHPLLFAALRFAVFAVPAVFVLPRPAVGWRQLALVGTLLGSCQFGLLFVSLEEGMPVGLSSLVMQLNAVFTVALAVVLLGERPGRGQLVGAFIAFLGIAVIGADRSGPHVPTVALLLCVAAAASWGAGNVVLRRLQSPDPLALMVWSSLAAPLPLLALALVFDGPGSIGHDLSHATAKSVGGLLFVVVVASGFGFGTWAWLMARHAASKVAPFTLLVPVFGIGSAWLFLGEQPSAVELGGGVIVVAGLGLVSAALRVPRGALPLTGVASDVAAGDDPPPVPAVTDVRVS